MAVQTTIPAIILREGTSRSTGREAQRSNIMAAKVIAETVRSTLGPRGMDKMLVSTIGDVTITNDGATILKELDVQHPAAKMLVEVAKTMDNEVGDGTTTAAVLAGELLDKAQKLIEQNIHPTLIVSGYRKAAEEAESTLEKIAVKIDPDNLEDLKKIALTSISSKGAIAAGDQLSNISVQACKQVAEDINGKLKVDIDLIKVLKKHGQSLDETELVKGIVVDKEISHPQMPKRVENAKIALLNAKLEIEKTEFDAKINIENPEQMKAFLDEEEKMIRGMADRIAASGANVVMCQKGIDDLALHFLAKKGIVAVKNVSSGDLEKLAKASGGHILANVDELTKEHLGSAKVVEEIKIGDDKLVYARDCANPRAVTIVVRGGTEHVTDEAERSIHDALCVVRNAVEDGKIVAGGGAPEAEASKRLKEYAVKIGGREQLAIEAFAEALESIPITIGENAGLDPIDVMADLRAKHEKPEGLWYGVDVETGSSSDMFKANVIEPLRVKKQAIRSASEAAEMILRIDDLISAKGMKEERMPRGPEKPKFGEED